MVLVVWLVAGAVFVVATLWPCCPASGNRAMPTGTTSATAAAPIAAVPAIRRVRRRPAFWRTVPAGSAVAGTDWPAMRRSAALS